MGTRNVPILESVAFDTGYAGSNGNGPSYIYFGSGEFDGQGSGHDYMGTLYMPPTGFVNNSTAAARTPTATTARSKRSGRNPTRARRGQLRPHDHVTLS